MDESSPPKLLSEAILIAAFTLIGYLTALFYEVGVCYFFNIPFILIEVKLTNTLIVGGLIYLIATSIYGGATFFLHFFYAYFKINPKLLFLELLLAITVILGYFLILSVLSDYLILIWAKVLSFTLSAASTYLYIRIVKDTKLKYKKQAENGGEVSSPILKGMELGKKYNLNFTLVVFAITLPTLASAFAYWGCGMIYPYMTNGKTVKTIVIRKYDNNYIATTYNAKTHILGDSIFILNQEAIMKFKIENLGPFTHRVISLKTTNERD